MGFSSTIIGFARQGAGNAALPSRIDAGRPAPRQRTLALALAFPALLFGAPSAAGETARPWLDGRHADYHLLWQDTVPAERLAEPFTRETFDAAGWRVSTWNDDLNERFGKFAEAPDGTPAIEVRFPTMSYWRDGGIEIQTDHFAGKDSTDSVVYAYELMLEINPSDYTVEENRSGIISGKLAGLYSDNRDLGRIPARQKGWVTREVWRGRRGDPAPRVGSYDYHLNRTDEPEEITYGVAIGDDAVVEPMRWVKIAREVVFNDPGVPNGKSRMWVDGKLVADRDDLLYLEGPEYPLRGMRFHTFCGGSHPWLVNEDWRIWFRNFQLWVPAGAESPENAASTVP